MRRRLKLNVWTPKTSVEGMKTVDSLAAKKRLSNNVGETASGHTAEDMLVPKVSAGPAGRSLAGTAGSNPSGRMDVCL
jgi:hypothetical protein